MASTAPKLSPALDAMVERGLFNRLPVTFSTFFYDQIQEWELLFPAERNYYERLFGLLDRTDPGAVDRLFAGVRDAEHKLGVTETNWPKRTFTLQQVDFLNRSPHYPEWRKAIADVFSQVDPVLDAEVSRHGRPRLVIVVSPRDMPVGPDRLWTRISTHGRRVAIDAPQDDADYLPLLLTGQPLTSHAPPLADLLAAHSGTPRYSGWCVETGDQLAQMSTHPGVVRLSYQRLTNYRVRLMKEVQQVVDSGQIRGPRELGGRLKQLKIGVNESELVEDAILAEFARATLLSGNGTLLINNTFVEWASIQAIRRARPMVAIISYGIRNKVKPFSSLLIYTDQDTSTPIPTQGDMLGSYVDLEIFHQYIWQEFEKYAEYRGNTAFLFVAEGTDEMLAIGPPDFPLLSTTTPQHLETIFATLKEWLAL
ncbi:MAG TPA: hypothetical protein VGP62_15795 [Bryobacteraceae bacterium]|jgi:hypothetical protein|nr:hypothetical protein [Bryobacteraceae bacterium]